MIVKNESKLIERCLESVKPLIDYWVIVDTGSDDGTQDIIKEYMKDIPGELHEKPWINFSHNRNEALHLAKEKGDYLLFIDADDVLSYAPNFRRPILTKDAYYLDIQYGGVRYSRVHLARSSLNWCWGGAVHEALFCMDPASYDTLQGVKMVIIGGGSRSADPEKYLKDAKILEAEIEKDPENTRNVFYLAQSYRDAGEYELALREYQKRVALGGWWDQEIFWSLYQIGLIQELLKYPDDLILKSFYKAFEYRPKRIEPLYQLAHYYRTKEIYFLGYLIAKQAIEVQEAPTDFLFVEDWIYDYGLLLEYSICAFWIGKYEEAYRINLQLLNRPNLPAHVVDCVQRNMKFTLEKMLK